MSHPDRARAFDAPEYDAGYLEGWNACVDVIVQQTDDGAPDEPPEHLTEGMGARRRDGFRDGWGDALVECEA